MIGTIILWAMIVSVLVFAFLLRTWEKMHESRKNGMEKSHILEMGKDKDIFFVPGDEKFEADDEFEDL